MVTLGQGRRLCCRRPHRIRLGLLLAAVLVPWSSIATAQSLPEIKLAPAVEKLIADPATLPVERRALRIFHGQWDGLENLTIAEQAAVALLRFDLDHPSLHDQQAPALTRARAALLRGDPAMVETLLSHDVSFKAMALRGEALEQLGHFSQASELLHPLRPLLRQSPPEDAAELTAAAEALVLLARLEGRPAQDYHEAMAMLARARDDLDRFHWPTHLAEARILMDKDNYPEAQQAVMAALQLNPLAAEAWYRLGLLAAEGFQFDLAGQCARRLYDMQPHHLLADLLAVQSLLAQRDAATAREILAGTVERYGRNRTVAALRVAVAAMAFDDPASAEALADFDALSPGHPLARALTGKYLALARQYDAGEAILRDAIAQQPNWSEPRVELGLLLMQSGDEEKAYTQLQEAARLDPFNVRAANQLELLHELRNYARIETEHFIIKYKPGIDEVLARDMPEELERIYRDITATYDHRPRRVTLIELLPDERHFGVRITGIPEIWTIAASTGDVIALTPPRPGARQRGSFDWARVVRHEFVHTVTLDQTANRLPHWFTEACAVASEPGDRDFQSCQLLAMALKNGELFDLSQINWAFVRPKRPEDRALAYAQAHWMLEYITETFGHRAIVTMLHRFRHGATTEQAIAHVTGQTPEAFFASFESWASQQVRQWGLDHWVSVDPQQIRTLPDHPLNLRAAAERAMRGDPASARPLVMRYAAAVPVDPWAQQAMLELAMKSGDRQAAIAALAQLDRQEQESGRWAYQLTQLYRQENMLEMAEEAIRRALFREPYNASYREMAATVALQRQDHVRGLRHLESLTILEPERSIHFVRLAAMHHRMNQHDQARAAALKARQLDPGAAVDDFLSP